ncbi:hypothetical protein OG342_00490 [Streptomyces bobili]|uniref:hypothetical protein n=1 Tax=Streptomyces bobili TaxID=67280 RepID=UPI00224E7E7C|nr:hypothetical protein [Streptomyces bobili]MCX5521373.1 hypothetical protein [Streptomyces bobili]
MGHCRHLVRFASTPRRLDASTPRRLDASTPRRLDAGYRSTLTVHEVPREPETSRVEWSFTHHLPAYPPVWKG